MSEHEITLTVDGERQTLSVEARTLLVHALRDELGYTGPNVGCETSSCGACTVHLDGEAVKSCTVLAVQADGGVVRTIEDVGQPDDLHPVQEAFHEEHGLQCGYCTPGMVMTTLDLLEDDPDPDEEEIRDALKGNLCRCTGYGAIVDAVESAADKVSAEASGEEADDDAQGREPAAGGGAE